MLQENKPDAVCTYVHTYFDTYSDRHVLGCLLLFAGVIALLCCPVLAAQRQHKILVRSTAVLLLLCTGAAVPPATLAHKEAWTGMTDICSTVHGPTF